MTCTLEPLVSFQGLNLSSSSSPKSLDKIIFFTQPSESIPESFLASATPKPLYRLNLNSITPENFSYEKSVESFESSATPRSLSEILGNLSNSPLPNNTISDYEKFKSSATPKPWERVVKNLLSQNFSFSEQKSEIGFDEKKLPAINLDLNCAGIGGTNGYQNLPQESLFMENHLLKQTRELMEDFKINPNLLKGIDLVDGNRNDDDNDVGLGGAYDWAEKRLKISPFPIKPHDSTNYERFVFDNVLSHEMGHVKAVEKFGTPDSRKLSRVNDWAINEFTADCFADKNDLNYGNAQQELLGFDSIRKNSLINPIIEIDKIIEDDFSKSRNSHELFGEVIYYKASAKKFNIPELNNVIDFGLYEGLYNKTNSFAKTEDWVNKINKISYQVYNLGETSINEDKEKYMEDFKKIQENIGELDKEYKELDFFGKMMNEFRRNFLK